MTAINALCIDLFQLALKMGAMYVLIPIGKLPVRERVLIPIRALAGGAYLM